ncbi:hypothetical protein VIBNISFn27_200006 [Vibrio nigripulchritudo SFn27]|uniref:Uncharacterized protein n=2 Tax=Vibrio nigripulchritudo TaxID=28173 RepID=U4KJ30_9VIBR|nr:MULTISPECIES: hypothetical protein [Vibrio]UAB73121.1 hypothetical protein INR79_18285 [Vibrio sp. SCSIO 43132]CCN35784.1 hypothetical protein VIBNIAM115_1940015 [Vibrio nigripulchritudo AM115]CCN41178.1 hypothetical protein VIBNIFTn2_1490011 [Vibrio nigripulchritudo FTn2]CCN68214.1 hypothetical protein VIBNIPon4_980015 [Vibrio nigripulchritudo POn4]CCN75203.1 hypothetical protein VIBNISO65_130015 [Vibrio nigripulchritudo SO65]
MKKITLLASIVGLSLISSIANAACNRDECYGKGAQVVSSMMVHEGGVYIIPPESSRNNLDCQLDGTSMTLNKNHPYFDEVYSTILTAMAAGNNLMVRIKNGSKGCQVSYARIYY